MEIEYLKSSLVKKEFEVIDTWLNNLDVDVVYKKIMQEINDVLFVGISSYMSNTAPTIDLIQKLKKTNENIKVVCGGFGLTFYPQQYLKVKYDYIIHSDGE